MANSSSNSQEEYIHSLRRIKEAEEKVQDEIKNYKNQVEQEIKNLHDELKNTLEISKQDGEQMVEKSIEESKGKAFAESERIINEATKQSKSISFKPDKQTIREIMDILFSEVKSDNEGDNAI
jgi:vacuolar-type H+-ATPase subunit H